MDLIELKDADEASIDTIDNFYPKKAKNQPSPDALDNVGSFGINSENNDESREEISLINIMLGHDCLAKVFSHLSVPEILEMKKVCHKWKETVHLAWYLVKKIDLGNLLIPIDKKEKLLKQILMTCGPYLTHLKMNRSHYYSSIKNILIENCKNVTHFDIDIDLDIAIPFSHKDLLQIISSMSKLNYLKIKSENLTDFYTEILEILPENMKEIHLNCQYDLVLSPRFAPALDKFKDLQGLSLAGISLTDTIVNSIVQKKNTLVYLDLDNCEFPFIPPIFSNFTNLEHLCLNKINNLNNDLELIAISEYCKKLKHFEFRGSGIVPYQVFYYFKNLKNLEYFHFFSSDPDIDTSNFLPDFLNNCQKLKYLQLEFIINLSVSSFRNVVKLTNLEYFIVPYLQIDSKLLSDIANNCLNLKESVSLPYGISVSEEALEKFVNLKKLKRLTNIERCKYFNDNILIRVINNCKNLVELNIGKWNDITEVSLRQIGKLKNLEKLSFGDIYIPHGIFNNLCKLKELCCSGCLSITDMHIIQVMNNCPELEKLYLEKTAITIEILIFASKRKFKFKHLSITVSEFVYNEYLENDYSFESDHLTVIDGGY